MQQREQARKNAIDKKEKNKRKEERDSKAQPDALVRTHAITHFVKPQVDFKSPIDEADAESEYSHLPGDKPRETDEQVQTRREYERRTEFITMYKRIDQTTIESIGLKSKASLGEDSIEDIHGFSLLQRFRGDKDMNAFDRAKPLLEPPSDDSGSEESDEDACENINLNNVNPEVSQ